MAAIREGLLADTTHEWFFSSMSASDVIVQHGLIGKGFRTHWAFELLYTIMLFLVKGKIPRCGIVLPTNVTFIQLFTCVTPHMGLQFFL